jgi:hypothetical protein
MSKLTNKEFASLERNNEGRITGDFEMAWVCMTDSQKELLHHDDISWGEDLDEELMIMASEFF